MDGWRPSSARPKEVPEGMVYLRRVHGAGCVARCILWLLVLLVTWGGPGGAVPLALAGEGPQPGEASGSGQGGESGRGGPGQEAKPASPKLTPPKLVHFQEATYPKEAFEQGLGAAVKLAIAIDEQGRVTNVQVLEPAGHGFDEAAVAAARRFEFEPARLGDEPVPVTIRFTYRFQVTTRPEPEALAKVRGRVLAMGYGRPVSGATVRAGGSAVVTDDQGRFEVSVQPGEVEVHVTHPDYQPFDTKEEIREGEALDVTYYLEQAARARYHSVVTATRPRKAVTRTSLEHVELVKVPGTFGEPFRVIQALPGVARSPFGVGLVMVRGAAPMDSGFFIDGWEVPIMYHFMAGPAVFQADLVNGIDFYPGNFPVRYGRKQAGIVAVDVKDPERPDGLHGMASLDMLDMEALARFPLGEDGNGAIAFRRSHFDLIIRSLAGDTVLPRYWDYQGVAQAGLGHGWRGRLTLFGSYDALDVGVEPDSKEDPGTGIQANLGIQFHRLHGRAWRPVLDDMGKLVLSVALGYDLTSMKLDRNLVDADARHVGLRACLDLTPIPDRLEIQGGLEVVLGDTTMELDMPGMPNFTDFPTPPAEDEEHPRSTLDWSMPFVAPAAFVDAKLELGDLTLIPGLRVDYFRFDEFEDLTFDPRFVARYSPLEGLTFKGGVGVFHQTPTGQELDSTYGNPTGISSPYGVQTSTGVEYSPLEFLDLDLTLFFNRYEDLITMQAQEESGGMVTRGSTFTNDGQGRSYGMELLVRHRPHGPFFGWIAYTLSRSERRWSSDDDWQPFRFDQTHILTLVGSWRLGSRWTLGLRFRLVSGIPRTPVLGGVYDSDTDTWVPVLGDPMSERNPAFHQLDLRVDRLFLFDTWRLTAYLDVMNVYNRANTEFVRYDYDYTESQTIPGIPLFPSLGVKGEF